MSNKLRRNSKKELIASSEGTMKMADVFRTSFKNSIDKCQQDNFDILLKGRFIMTGASDDKGILI